MQTLNLNLKVSIVQTRIVAEHEERPTLHNNSDIAILSAVLFRMLTASSAGVGVHLHACQLVHPICSHSSFRPFREALQCSSSKRSFCSTLRTNSQGVRVCVFHACGLSK